MSGIRETNEATMIAAHKAGVAYWTRNKPTGANAEALSLARSCGWHGADETAWLAGFYGAKFRHEQQKLEKVNLNPLEVYADAGRKAAIAVNENDWARSKFHSDWMQRAVALESRQWAQMARAAFDEAYKATRRI